MEDLFDEKLLEAIRLAEALQDGQSEEKEPEVKKTEVKQETESSSPVSRQEEPAAAPAPQTGEEAVDLLIKEIVQEAQDEIAAEGIRTEDIKKNFFQKKAENQNETSFREKTQNQKRDIEKSTDEDLYVRAREHKRMGPKKLRDPWSLKKKIIVGTFVAILVLVGIPTAILAWMINQGKKQLAANAASEIISFHEDGSHSTSVTYNGKNYVYNKDIISILVFGVDNSEYQAPKEDSSDDLNLYGEETTEETDTRDRDDELTYSDANGSEYVRYGGRVDMCFLFVFNKKTGKLDVIDINRDSMTDVDICTTKGEVALTDTMQVGLAYGYADGGTISCQNFTKKISEMLYDLPIHGYIALDMEGIADINDAVKGVTLYAKDTVSENVFAKDTVTLEDEDAYKYVEKMATRVETLGEHANRMARQEQYLTLWIERFLQLYGDSRKEAKVVYEAAKPYMQTNLDRNDILYLYYRMHGIDLNVTESDVTDLPGKYERNTYFDEYKLDQEALVDLLIRVFYTEKE